MFENPGFWFWLLLMLFIASVIGSLGLVVWRSDRRGDNDWKPPEDADRASRANTPRVGQK